VTTFHELLRDRAAAHGERAAIRFEDETLSYAALLARAERLAGGLGGQGIGPADRVAIVMENSVECLLSWLALSLIGCADVPVNPEYRGDLLCYLLQDSEATAVICDAAFLGQVAEVAPRLASLRLIVVNGELDAASGGPQAASLAACAEARGSAPIVSGADERVILYTSGTTGPSKGVIHTQRSCLTLASYNAEVLGYGLDDRLLNFFPLYHQNSRYTGVVPALWAGASIRLERRFSSSGFWRTCAADGVTAFNYLGSVLRLILNVTPPDLTAEGHTVRKAFGAGAPAALWSEFEDRLGIRLVETYGLSEAPMTTLNTREAGRRSPLGSAGRASDLFEVAVVDGEDNRLGPDAVGEIVLRPRRPDAMMLGYHNKDAATVAAFRNLWFHSGDRGRLSAEGDLYFEERSKDSIRRRGENISAWEVESVLDQHPDVAESAVFGVASEEADEEVAAALVLKRADADVADILRFAEARLPRYAAPTLIRVMDDLPRTPTAKVQKAELRAAGRAGCLTKSDIEAGVAPASRKERHD
jgi:crotonobetaine/carnitine-CoA ligase